MKNLNLFLMLIFMTIATTIVHGADHRVRDKDKISRFNRLFRDAPLDERRELLGLYTDALVLDYLDEDKVALGTNIHLVEEVNRDDNERYKDFLEVLYGQFRKRFQEPYQDWSEERMWE